MKFKFTLSGNHKRRRKSSLTENITALSQNYFLLLFVFITISVVHGDFCVKHLTT